MRITSLVIVHTILKPNLYLVYVLDGNNLTTEEMQPMANWTNLSGITFVCKPSDPHADNLLLIFIPQCELPFARHPVTAIEDNGQGMKWMEIAATNEAETSIVLHNKELIAKMQPELNLSTPSLLFFSENLEKYHHELSDKKVTVSEIMTMGSRKVFNFADSEENYFAVMEK